MNILEGGTFELVDGRFLHYVSDVQKFKVYDIKVDTISNISHYYIGKSNETITSKSAAIFMKGHYISVKEYIIPIGKIRYRINVTLVILLQYTSFLRRNYL